MTVDKKFMMEYNTQISIIINAIHKAKNTPTHKEIDIAIQLIKDLNL